jgi:hypothetical protein
MFNLWAPTIEPYSQLSPLSGVAEQGARQLT